MKKVSVILISILFAACNPSKPVIPKYNHNEVYFVLYSVPPYKYDSALGKEVGSINKTYGKIDSIYASPVIDDPNTLKAHFKLDTNWVLSIQNIKDTVRLPNGKPDYDSVNRVYKFNNNWYKLSPAERANVKVQIITI